jgi:hypothetical protein
VKIFMKKEGKKKRLTRTWQGFEGCVMNFLECISLHEYQAFLTLVCVCVWVIVIQGMKRCCVVLDIYQEL